MAEGLTPHQEIYRQALADAQSREKKSKAQEYKERLTQMLRSRDLHEGMVHEHRFHPDRMWRFDFAWPDRKVAIEFQGGTFGRVVTCDRCFDGPGVPHKVRRRLKDGREIPVREGGHHNTGEGLMRDFEKSNAAQELGWRVLLCTDKHLKTWDFVELVGRLISRSPSTAQADLFARAI